MNSRRWTGSRRTPRKTRSCRSSHRRGTPRRGPTSRRSRSGECWPGIPISMIPLQKYQDASQRILVMFHQSDINRAYAIACELGVQYLYIGPAERQDVSARRRGARRSASVPPSRVSQCHGQHLVPHSQSCLGCLAGLTLRRRGIRAGGSPRPSSTPVRDVDDVGERDVVPQVERRRDKSERVQFLFQFTGFRSSRPARTRSSDRRAAW